jgi:hypothetical protein
MEQEALCQLQREQIEHGELPLIELLKDSFYYPACEFDGAAIKHFGRAINSFVYCDYSVAQESLVERLDSFRGYKLIGDRSLGMEELIPNGWTPQLPPYIHSSQYLKYKDHFKKPFAHWAVYERRDDYDENHGPMIFSMIYVGGEAVATYQALYWTNGVVAKGLAIIRPGTGFGLNWTNFFRGDAPLAWVVINNPAGAPDFVVCQKDLELSWPNYVIEPPDHTLDESPEAGPFCIWKNVL